MLVQRRLFNRNSPAEGNNKTARPPKASNPFDQSINAQASRKADRTKLTTASASLAIACHTHAPTNVGEPDGVSSMANCATHGDGDFHGPYQPPATVHSRSNARDNKSRPAKPAGARSTAKWAVVDPPGYCAVSIFELLWCGTESTF